MDSATGVLNKLYEIYFAVIFIIILSISYLLGSFMQLFYKKRINFWFDWFYYTWSLLFFLTGIRVKAKNYYADTPVVFASNHISLLDGFVYDKIIRSPIFAIVEPYDKFPPLIAPLLKKINCVPVIRSDENPKYKDGYSTEGAVKKCVQQLKTESLMIFPEGHVERHKRFMNFHTGAIRIALEARTNIIPCHIYHSDDLIEPDFKWVKPGKVTVVFGKEWDLSEYYGMQDNHLLVRLLTRQLELKIKKLHPRYSKK